MSVRIVHAWGIVRGVFPIAGWSEPDRNGKVAFNTNFVAGLPGDSLRNRNVGSDFPKGSMNGVKYVPRIDGKFSSGSRTKHSVRSAHRGNTEPSVSADGFAVVDLNS